MDDNGQIAEREAGAAVESAHAAYLALSQFDQSRIDVICDAMAAAALDEAARLGRLAHEETGFGKPEDKREKNRFAAEDVWRHFRPMRTVGVLSDSKGIVEIASPRGVVAAIIPSTNPTSTAIFKIIIAIKSRNSIVLSPHPSARGCIAETARVMVEAGRAAGLPDNAVICLENTTIKGTEALMKHRQTAVILATGGIGLVRAAYSSGKPAFGVGPGNVPVFIERSADVEKAVADVLTGTCFDNGTICASEQSVVVDAPVEAAVREQFIRQGGHFLSPEEAKKVAEVLVTTERTLNPKIVGKSAAFIADLAGVSVPDAMPLGRLRRCRPRPSLVDRKAFANAGVVRSGWDKSRCRPLSRDTPIRWHGAYGRDAHERPARGGPLRRTDARGPGGHQFADHSRCDRAFHRPAAVNDARLRIVGWKCDFRQCTAGASSRHKACCVRNKARKPSRCGKTGLHNRKRAGDGTKTSPGPYPDRGSC